MITFIKVIYEWLKPFLKKLSRDNISAIAGQTAFYLILSFVPLVMFLMSMLQKIHMSPDMLNVIVGSKRTQADLQSMTESLNSLYQTSVGVSIVSLVATLWSASKGMHAITNGLNRVHNTYENRNWFVVRLRAMVHTFLFLLIIVVTVVIIFLGSMLNDVIKDKGISLPWFLGWLYHLRYVLVFLYQVFLFALLYRSIPNLTRETRKKFGIRCQLPGALFCAASWHVLLFGISIYVTDFNGFSIYRGLAKLAVVMIFTYFCMYCLMLGAEINYYFNREIDWFTRKLVPRPIRVWRKKREARKNLKPKS